jgi:hypothetical protein
MLHEKKLAKVDTNNLPNEGTHCILSKKTTHNNSTKKLSETDIITMIEFFIDNVFVKFDGRVFQQKIVILEDTNCAHLLADLIQGLLTKNENNLFRTCNLTFQYIDDVLSLYNSKFDDLLDHTYPFALEISNTTDTARPILTVRSG